LKRYQLVSIDESITEEEDTDPLEAIPAIRTGTREFKSTAPIIRKASSAKEFDPIHNQMQNELFVLLSSRFAEGSVLLEDNFVDLKIITPNKVIFVEVKTDPTPRRAIRQALGQLMEYAFFNQKNATLNINLIVVAPGKAGVEDEKYLKKLEQEFKIPISYRRFVLGEQTFELTV
jgi:hypothetical protein